MTAANVSPRRSGERRPKRGYWALPPNGEGCLENKPQYHSNTAHSAVGNLKDLKETVILIILFILQTL